MTPLFLRRRDAAEVLGVSESQILKWERVGLLRPVPLALPDAPGATIRAVRYRREDVEALAARFAAAADTARG